MLKKKQELERIDLEKQHLNLDKQHEADVLKARQDIEAEKDKIVQQKINTDNNEARKKELDKKEQKIKSAKKVIDLIVEDLKLTPNTTSAEEFLKKEAELKEQRKKAEEEYKKHLETSIIANETEQFKKKIEEELLKMNATNKTNAT